MTTEETKQNQEPTPAQNQAMDKFGKDYFSKNKLHFDLTFDQYHAIINVMAECKLNVGFYVMRDLLALGDPQKDKLVNEYNNQLAKFKANGYKNEKPRIRVKAVKTTARKTA